MSKENLFLKDCIRTFTGKYLNVRDPQPDQIDIVDIAVGLSRICRFAAHTQSFLPVAQHCIHMSEIAPLEHKLAALLHDASEAYIGDIPKPAKNLLPDYQALEDRLMAVIAEKYGFQWPLHEHVKALDHQMLCTEWNNNVLSDRGRKMLKVEAKYLFLLRFGSLTGFESITFESIFLKKQYPWN